jgi:hypothetical protein
MYIKDYGDKSSSIDSPRAGGYPICFGNRQKITLIA